MGRVQGKVAVVTGGALGIGLSTCELLAREGAKVAVTDLLDREGRELAQRIAAHGGAAKFWHLDVTRETEVQQVLVEVREAFGPIQVLVNNAGISGVDKPTHEISGEEWDQVMDVNVKGVFLATKHAIPQMLESGGGSIINLSSVYGIVGAKDTPPYHASKGAVRLMTKTDAMFYAKEGIRVNSVHPGFIWTPLVEAAAQGWPDGPEEYRQRLDRMHPLGHVGDAEDIAYGILYLASDESKFVTGSELVIDGGYTAR